MSKELISLCAIVRNESAHLARMLTSIRNLVGEIVIVDTGSTDGTQAIAMNYGARIYDFPWNENFAEARNFSIALATSPTILVLDADESIDQRDHEHLRSAVSSRPSAAISFRHRHYSNDQGASGFCTLSKETDATLPSCAGFTETRIIRMFPAHTNLIFQGRVHEQIDLSKNHVPVLETPAIIHHFGHLDLKRREERNSLYCKLGAHKVNDQPNSWQAHYELAVSLTRLGRLGEATQHFETALALNAPYAKTWSDYGHLLTQLGLYREAEAVLAKGARQFPSDIDIALNRGSLKFAQGQYSDAVYLFEQALLISPAHPRALKNLAVSALRSASAEEACSKAETACRILESDAEAWHLLGMARLLRGDPQLACESFKRALLHDPNFEDSRIALESLSEHPSEKSC